MKHLGCQAALIIYVYFGLGKMYERNTERRCSMAKYLSWTVSVESCVADVEGYPQHCLCCRE
jgi:hypothetical protein